MSMIVTLNLKSIKVSLNQSMKQANSIIITFNYAIKLGLFCAVFSFVTQTLTAQSLTLKQELLENLKSVSFDEFVANQKNFLERSASIIEGETLKKQFFCNEDNSLGELKFVNKSFSMTTFKKEQVVSIVESISKNVTFEQFMGINGSIIKLKLNPEIQNLLRPYEHSGLNFQTTIHNIKYEDGTVSKENLMFNDTEFNISTDKNIKELEATVTIEYPKIKVYRIIDDYQKIIEENESIEIRVKENKIQIVVPKENTKFLSLEDVQEIDAIHKSEKTIEIISSSSHRVLTESSLKNLAKTVEFIENIQNRVDAQHIINKGQLTEAMEQLPEFIFKDEWYTNNCYYGDIEEVLFYFNTKKIETVTEEITIKRS